jgi:hypothetical protein
LHAARPARALPTLALCFWRFARLTAAASAARAPFRAQEFIDTPRGQATLALRNDLRSQLSKAVSMQQEMLQHLDSLVRADGPAVGSLDDAPSVKAEEAEAAAVVDTLFAESEFDHSYVGAHAAPPHTNGALGHADGATAKSTGGAS